MPSRFLHEIEFFPDIVSDDMAIRHMKEITRHGLDQPSDLSRSKVDKSRMATLRAFREGCGMRT
jgi:hypothetical protein